MTTSSSSPRKSSLKATSRPFVGSKEGKASRNASQRSQFWNVVLDILEALDCAESLSIAIMIRYADYQQAVLHSDIDPLRYNSPHAFRRAYQSLKLISKLDIDVGIDRIGAAKEAFWKSEIKCLQVNDKFSKFWKGDASVFSSDCLAVLAKAQKIISSILGPCPEPDSLCSRFGPGATFSRRGHSSTLIDKIGELSPSITFNARPLLKHIPTVLLESYTLGLNFESEGGTFPLSITEVLGSEFVTVPKNAKTFRGICIEPSLNSFWQLGYGGYIRQRLKRRGLNLDRQAEFNGHYARIGSRNSYYATIDLEGASDSISHNLILDLLPVDWVEALALCRSPYTLIDGKWHQLQKWSSMGNGYTFELETLVFYAICLAITEDSRVFGDDIIVPSDHASHVISTLDEIGFTVNKSKTFVDGPFRESCGQDFFLGASVRPLFIKELPNGITERIFNLANLVREIAYRDYLGLGCNRRFRRPWLRVVEWLPQHLRLFGPRYLGNLVINTDREHWLSGARYRYGITRIKVWAPSVIRKNIARYHPEAQMAYALYGGSSSGSEFRSRADYRIKTQNVLCEEHVGATWM